MDMRTFEAAVHAWPSVAPAVFVPHTDTEYARLIETLDELLERIGEDECHPLASMMAVIGALIEQYESAQVPELVPHR